MEAKNKRLKIGVFGGARGYTMIQVLFSHDKADLVAVCDKYEPLLDKVKEKAKELGYDYFTTTLTVSPLKNAEKLNSIGKKVEEQTGVKFLPTDFKKRGGYLHSIELSREYDLYRQPYCGCIYSLEQAKNKCKIN